MPARILYAGQQVSITANNGAQRFLPVQSASCEVTNPIEDVLSFGHLGSLGRFQTNVSTCKSDIKTYISLQTGTGLVGDASRVNYLDSEFISQLTGESLNGLVSTISVSPNGFTMSGILSNISIDIANGQFATASLSFGGVGQPFFSPSPTGTSFLQQSNMPTAFTPVNASYVSGNVNTGCASSFKFSLDIPTDTLVCLGGIVTGTQTQVANNFLYVAKPPFKANISVEGTAVDAPSPAAATNVYTVGYLNMQLPAAKVTSHSFNNSVGAVGATFNYTIEDVSAVFSDNPNLYGY